MPGVSVVLVAQVTAVALLGAAALTSAGAPPAAGYLAAAGLAGFGELAGAAALYRALAVGRMSVVAPISAAAPAVPLVAGLVIGEVPGPLQSAGLVLIVLGIVFAAGVRVGAADLPVHRRAGDRGGDARDAVPAARGPHRPAGARRHRPARHRGDAMYATATTLGFLSVVAVLAALHSVVTIGLARFFLAERVAGWQQAGIVGCLSGVTVLAVA
jgi:drug/metabolite transporter (DMT)-like permease